MYKTSLSLLSLKSEKMPMRSREAEDKAFKIRNIHILITTLMGMDVV